MCKTCILEERDNEQDLASNISKSGGEYRQNKSPLNINHEITQNEHWYRKKMDTDLSPENRDKEDDEGPGQRKMTIEDYNISGPFKPSITLKSEYFNQFSESHVSDRAI